MATKKSTAPKSVIIRTYSDYTKGKHLLHWPDIEEMPPVEVIMATPYSDDVKQCLLRFREKRLSQQTMTA